MKTYEIKFRVNITENAEDEGLRVEILHKLMFEMVGECDFVNQVIDDYGYYELVDVEATSIQEVNKGINLYNKDTFVNNRFNEI